MMDGFLNLVETDYVLVSYKFAAGAGVLISIYRSLEYSKSLLAECAPKALPVALSRTFFIGDFGFDLKLRGE